MQLQELIDKIKLPRIDIVEGETVLLVIFKHGAKIFAVVGEQGLLEFIYFVVFGGDLNHHCIGLHLVMLLLCLWVTGKMVKIGRLTDHFLPK